MAGGDVARTGPVLVLSGSAEGYRMAELLYAAGMDALSSFAGVTEARRRPAGAMRVGGFGGVAGLASFLGEAGVRAVIDATHPFADTMTRNAAEACRIANVPSLHILRPAWTPQAGDRWHVVRSLAEAADRLPAGARAFLTIGRSEIGAFAHRADVVFLARCIDPPGPPVPPRLTLLRSKGPFRLEEERALLAAHGISWLVTKNSGGEAAAAKLEAAREAGIDVVMIERPPAPPGDRVETPEAALDWVRRLPA